MPTLRRTAAVLAALALAAPAAAQEPAEPAANRILPGDPAIQAGRIAPATDTFRVLVVANGVELQTGSMVQDTRLVDGPGGPVLQRVYVAAGGIARVDSFAVSPRTLQAVWLRTMRRGRRLRLEWDGATTGGTITEGDRTGTVVANLPSAVFPADGTDLVLRALPLRDGFSGAWPVYDDMRGARRWIWAMVHGQETLTLADASTVDTWTVSVGDGPDVASYWIAKSDGRLIRYAGPMAGGATFVITR